MKSDRPAGRYRFGIFEADASTGELRRQGLRVKLGSQPFQVLVMLLEHPGELLTREQIARELWPEGTFVDYEHGVNSAVNRVREALRDSAGNPRFIETLARRGYRFVAPVERIASGDALPADAALPPGPPLPQDSPVPNEPPGWRILSSAHDLPKASNRVVLPLFALLQCMYLGFYIGALANLAEIESLFSVLPSSHAWLMALIVTAALLIPVRAFVLSAVLFRAPRARSNFLRLWPSLLVLDEMWALAPFLLLHHISFGLAVACIALLVYSPFAQRSLLLMSEAPPRRGAPPSPDPEAL